GKDTQTLSAGAVPVKFGGQTFASPQQLRYEFRFGYAEALYRYRWLWGGQGNFGLELVGGLGYGSVDMKVIGATQSASEKFGSGGLVAGAGFFGRLSPTLSVQARLSGFASDSTEGVTDLSRYDVFLAQTLGRNVALRGGFSGWTLHSRREDRAGTNSPITIRLAGPSIGFELMF